MDPQKLPDNNPPKPDEHKKPMDDFPKEDSSKLSLSEEPTKPVTVVSGGTTPGTVPEPPKPPTSESYSPLGAITPPNAPSASAPQAGGWRKKKLGLLALIVGVVVVLLGASAAAYFGYYLPNQPDNILKSALVNSFSTTKASTMHFNGEASVTENTSKTKYSVDFEGASSHDGKFDLHASVDALVTKVTFDLRSLDGKSFFVRLGGLEGLPELLAQSEDPSVQMYGSMFMTLNNQWYEINESLIEQLTGNSFKMGGFSEADLQKIGSAYEKHPFLSVKDTLADEKINGTDSYHYKVAVDKDKLEGFVKAVKDANLDSIKLTQKNVDDFMNNFNSVDFAKYPLEIWIAKDSKLFKQMTFKTESEGATLDVRLTFTDYNKAVNVEKPEGAKSIMEALSDILAGGFTGTSLGSDVPDNMLQQLESDGVSL